VDFSAELSRRRWYHHWLRPGTDTPLGYFAGHVVFVALLLADLPGAILGHGWRFMPEAILPGLLDLTWLAKVLNSKRAGYRKLGFMGWLFSLTHHGRGEVLWIDTPESHVGVPQDQQP
jgi:hypothetical protein